MDAPMLFVMRNRRAIRRNRIYRDRTHPLEIWNDEQIYRRLRFPRHFIFELAHELSGDIDHAVARKGSLTAVLQVCLVLRYYATGAVQTVVGDIIGVDQSTACRTVTRVTDALFRRVREHVVFPNQEEADRQKVKFYSMRGFPDVYGCIDGTHIRIQAPADGHENDYVNRKNFHSLNVQVICNADLLFINVVSRWPGSVHDARILRNSQLFHDFELNRPPVRGIILGDSAYMLRWWLLTPLLNATTPPQRRYNYAHSSTRATVERSIGVAKQRWRCLRVGLTLEPQKASRVIMVCFMLHNRARRMNLPPPPDTDSDDSDVDDDDDHTGDRLCNHVPENANERARTAAGKLARDRIINNNFTGHLGDLQ